MANRRVRFEEWAPEKYPQRIAQCLEQYRPVIGQQFQKEITTEQFNWPNATRRRSGQLVPAGKRDIVDLGNFLRSQTPGQLVGLKKLQFEWTAAYALAIFLGYYTKGFQKEKARDWVTPALQKQPMQVFFAKNWKKTAQ